MTRSSTTDSGSSNDLLLAECLLVLRSAAVLTLTTNSFLGEMDVTFDTGRTVRSAKLYACFFVLLAGVCHAQIKMLPCFSVVCT